MVLSTGDEAAVEEVGVDGGNTSLQSPHIPSRESPPVCNNSVSVSSNIAPELQANTPPRPVDEENDFVFVESVKQHFLCKGHLLKFPPGETPHSSYPYMLHDTVSLPWSFQVWDGIMALRASSCTGKATSKSPSCRPCSDLQTNFNLLSIKHHIDHGVHENAPFAYNGLGGMMEIARRKGRQNDLQRIRKRNLARKLLGREGKIDEYKKMVLALSDKRIP